MKSTTTSDFILNSAMYHRRSLNSRFHNQLGPNQLSQLRGSLQKIAQAFKPGITINIETRARFSGRQIWSAVASAARHRFAFLPLPLGEGWGEGIARSPC